MKKIIGLVLLAVVLLGAGCSGKTTEGSTGSEATPSPKALPIKKVNCIDLPKQVPGASNIRFEVSKNCEIDHPIRIDKDNIVIVGNGVTLKPNQDNASSLDGFIVSSRNVIIDGFNFEGFRVPIFVGKEARVIVRNIRINDVKVTGVAVADISRQQPPFQKAVQQAPVSLYQTPLLESFAWISSASAEPGCKPNGNETLCEVAERVLADSGSLSLGDQCPQLELCGNVIILVSAPGSSAISVANASTLDNGANLTINVNPPQTSGSVAGAGLPLAKGLNISGSTVNLDAPTTINNTSGWGVFIDQTGGGTLNINATTTISRASNAVRCKGPLGIVKGSGSITIEGNNIAQLNSLCKNR